MLNRNGRGTNLAAIGRPALRHPRCRVDGLAGPGLLGRYFDATWYSFTYWLTGKVQ